MADGTRNGAALQRQCDAFNRVCPIGSPVTVRLDDGSTIDTVTRSKAQLLSGHTPVIWLDGVRGCYLLDRVTARAGEMGA